MTGGIITTIVHQGDTVELLVRDGEQRAIVTVQWPAPTCSIKPGDQLRWRAELAQAVAALDGPTVKHSLTVTTPEESSAHDAARAAGGAHD